LVLIQLINFWEEIAEKLKNAAGRKLYMAAMIYWTYMDEFGGAEQIRSRQSIEISKKLFKLDINPFAKNQGITILFLGSHPPLHSYIMLNI
jgi:hypothetical protein